MESTKRGGVIVTLQREIVQRKKKPQTLFDNPPLRQLVVHMLDFSTHNWKLFFIKHALSGVNSDKVMLKTQISASLFLISATIILALGTTMISTAAYAQSLQKVPTGNVINSKYLIINEQKFYTGPVERNFLGTISGTVVNNSTDSILFPHVTVILYDANNRVITTQQDNVALTTVGRGQASTFQMNLVVFGTLRGLQDEIDHYTLIPGGTP